MMLRDEIYLLDNKNNNIRSRGPGERAREIKMMGKREGEVLVTDREEERESEREREER